MSEDALQVPVIVREAVGTRRYLHWRKTLQPWPGFGEVPAPGAYRVGTTWRDVIDAAVTVGRDLAPWLAHRPHRAAHELLARVAP
ncbi:hypothetical protein J0910_30375 [Nocardiopsis sp. CNT-189]|uniref:hypothetical protein n=1 Tax=Nocardiopsis oceanisediminis TaxID=2816862 RepID=UPI003B32F5FD